MAIQLFPRDQIVGVFKGFREGGLEFHADLVLPYRNEFQNIPMHGQFLLVQLETPNEAVLGRYATCRIWKTSSFYSRRVVAQVSFINHSWPAESAWIFAGLRPADVIAIALGLDRQEQQNVRKLRGLDQGRWERLVNLIHQNGNQAALEDICEILDLDEERQQPEALAARANMTAIVRSLHDPGSQLMDMLIEALSKGKLCVVDVSQLRGTQAMILSGLILRRIFDRNQYEFTEAAPKTIPTIAVIEEAQSGLCGRRRLRGAIYFLGEGRTQVTIWERDL